MRTDLLALGLFAAVSFATVSLVSFDPADPPSMQVWPQNQTVGNLCGLNGATVAHSLLTLFGSGAWVLLAATFIFDLRLFCREDVDDLLLRVLGIVLMAAACSVALQVVAPTLGQGPVVGNGGYIGATARHWMLDHFSTAGSLIVVLTVFAAGLMLAADRLFLRVAYTVTLAPAVLVLRPLLSTARRRALASPAVPSSPETPTVALLDSPAPSVMPESAADAAGDDDDAEPESLPINDDRSEPPEPAPVSASPLRSLL